MTDTPIYDQLRLELSQESVGRDSSPPKPRAERVEKTPARPEAESRQPVSVWTLVNANRRKS